MPRLTNLDYFQQRAALEEEWIDNRGYAFVMLSFADQAALHQYYEPEKEWSPLELVEHRKRISREHPSLPQRAGRAFKQLRPFLNLPAPHPLPSNATIHPSSKPRGHGVAVFSLANPNLDPKQFARILYAAARDEIRRDRAAGGSQRPPRAKS